VFDPGSDPTPDDVRVVTGDAGEVLKRFPPGYFDGVVTDPPHGILRLDWDVLPSVEVWKEVLRTLKPGAPLLAVGAPRTYHRMVTSIETAGFIVEDIAVWAFATGRPPSPRRLRPAHAPILIARAPGPRLPLNIDEARLPFENEGDALGTKSIDTLRAGGRRRHGVYDRALDDNERGRAPFEPKAGRWPVNLLLTDDTVAGPSSKFFLVPKVKNPDGHPTAKPIALLSHVIRTFIPPHGRVLDPFAGSGTTGAAARVTGRRAVLVEKEERFAEMARLMSGNGSELVAAGVPLGDFAVELCTDRTRADTDESNPRRSAGPLSLTSKNEDLQDQRERATVDMSAELLTENDLSARLRISTRTLRRWMRDGHVSFIRVGKRGIRFDVRAVQSELAARGSDRRTDQPPPAPGDRSPSSPMPASEEQRDVRGRPDHARALRNSARRTTPGPDFVENHDLAVSSLCTPGALVVSTATTEDTVVPASRQSESVWHPHAHSPEERSNLRTAEQLVADLGAVLAPVTLSRWARTGRIPGFKVGRSWLFDLVAVMAALSNNSNGSQNTEVSSDVHFPDTSRHLHRSDLSLRPARGESSPMVQAGVGPTGGRSATAPLRERRQRMGRPSATDQGDTRKGTYRRSAFDPEQYSRIQRFFGTSLPALGQEPSRSADHDREIKHDPDSGS
jgi:site-specific DNA-methyltransferase (adenine-specific)